MSLETISRAILYAASHYQEQPSLEKLAQIAGLSPAHFQRTFQKSVGISPKRFIQHLTADAASQFLRSGRSVLDAALDSGLSGPGRLHDLMVSVEGATPGELASKGFGLEIKTALIPSVCGTLFAAKASRGLAYVAFVDNRAALAEAKAGLRRHWPKAHFKEDKASVEKSLEGNREGEIQCWVAGTAFQLQVWRALVRLPAGKTISYQGLAERSRLKGARAIGQAVASNPVALFIPCHRVIQASGALGGYHWGEGRKRALLALEGAGQLLPGLLDHGAE
jgi:AraC family transcriptional regulator of adaptative response/methylated-DNA-[protein]-cysteine methyltransferase